MLSDFAIWYWVGAAPVGALVLWLLYRGLWQDRSRGRARCPKCWYEMKGSEGRPCPECGHLVSEARKYFKTRRHWGNVVLAVVLGVMVMNGPAVRRRVVEDKEKWWEALEPTWVVILRKPVGEIFLPAPFSRFAGAIPARLNAEEERLTGWHVWLYAQVLRWRQVGSGDAAHAMQFLGGMTRHRAAVTELIRRVVDKDEEVNVRKAAMWGLGRAWGDRRVAGAMAAVLRDDDGRVGYEALAMCAKSSAEAMNSWTDSDMVKVLRGIGGMRLGSDLVRFEAGAVLLGGLRERRRPETGTALLEALTQITPARPIGDVELQMLMTARRLRGEADPLTVEWMTQGPVDCTPRGTEVLMVRIVNRDASGLTIRYRELCKPDYNNWRLRVQVETRSEQVMADCVAQYLTLPDLGPGESVEVPLQQVGLTPERLGVKTAQELTMHVAWEQWMSVAMYRPRETMLVVKSGEIGLRVRP